MKMRGASDVEVKAKDDEPEIHPRVQYHIDRGTITRKIRKWYQGVPSNYCHPTAGIPRQTGESGPRSRAVDDSNDSSESSDFKSSLGVTFKREC